MPTIRFFIAHVTILVTLAAAAAAGVVSVLPTPRRAFVLTDGDPGPDRLYALDFDIGAVLGPLNPSDDRTGLHDLVVRDFDLAERGDRIDLLVFDRESSEILRYARTAGTPEWFASSVLQGFFVLPDGLSLNSAGALYFVDSPSPARVWVVPPDRSDLPGGDGLASNPVLVDENLPCDLAIDTEVVKFQGPGLSFGDLVVLCQAPPLVLRYPKGKPCQDTSACTSAERQQLFELPPEEFPSSLVFTPGGDLLISSSDKDTGKIVRFSIVAGSLDVDPFVQGLPVGDASMVGGIQERGDMTLGPFLFYGNRGAMSVARFAPGPGGGVLDPGSANPLFVEGDPVGVGIGSSRAVPTRPGDGSRLRPRESLLATFDRVRSEGLTESRILRFADPRPLSAPDPLYLCLPGSTGCPVADATYFVDLGLPNVIPPNVRPLSVRSAASLSPVTAKGALSSSHPFVLFDLVSTAGFEDTVKLQGLEELVLGEDIYDCAEATGDLLREMPLFFHGADLDDPPVVEGADFFPVPSGCGSNFGRTFAFSSFLIGRLAGVPGPFAAARPSVVNLRTALNPITDEQGGGLASYLLPALRSELFVLADGALQALDRQDLGAIDALEELLQQVRDNPGAIDDSMRNVSGELKVRATTAIFLLCGGTNCSDAVDTHAEDVGEIFTDGFESGDVTAWTSSAP